ncbi:hypothetical protein ISS08_02300 [Candidatus Pacearchaeota archaeon]|nr:hypothetical protein [Candidatus Pacearchaeota archaeon]
MEKRVEAKHLGRTFFFSIIIATILFFSIFGITNTFAYMNYRSIEANNNAVLEDIISISSRLDEFECEDNLLSESSQDLDNSAFKISILEQRFGKHDYRVLKIKKLYSELEYTHFRLVNKFKEECGANFITILFFYVNDEDFEDDNERASFVIGAFKESHDVGVMIYSFDAELDLPLIKELREEYNVTYAPVIVMNEGEPFYPRNIDYLRGYAF